MSSNPFEDETVQNHPFLQDLKRAIGDKGERFWQPEANKFVSMEALRSDAEPVTVVLSKTQWDNLFYISSEATYE